MQMVSQDNVRFWIFLFDLHNIIQNWSMIKSVTENLPQAKRNPTTDKKLADVAGVSEKTYRMGAKVLNSNDEELKKRVLSGKTSISAGYKELQNQDKLKSTSVKRCRTGAINRHCVSHRQQKIFV